jgi:hypothetical protein
MRAVGTHYEPTRIYISKPMILILPLHIQGALRWLADCLIADMCGTMQSADRIEIFKGATCVAADLICFLSGMFP